MCSKPQTNKQNEPETNKQTNKQTKRMCSNYRKIYTCTSSGKLLQLNESKNKIQSQMGLFDRYPSTIFTKPEKRGAYCNLLVTDSSNLQNPSKNCLII